MIHKKTALDSYVNSTIRNTIRAIQNVNTTLYDNSQQILTLCFDGGSVDRCVRVSGQISGSQQVLADASSSFRHLRRVQVESLSGLNSKLWASAVSHGQTVRTLNTDSEMKVKSWVTAKSKYCIISPWISLLNKWKTQFRSFRAFI